MRQLAHEINDEGRHRIMQTEVPTFASPWVPYTSIAVLVDEGRTFVAFTRYWDGAVPVEQVLELVPIAQGAKVKVDARPLCRCGHTDLEHKRLSFPYTCTQCTCTGWIGEERSGVEPWEGSGTTAPS